MVKQKMLVKSKRDMRHKAIISYQTLVIMVGYQKVAWEKHWVAIFDKQDQTEDQRSPHFSPLPDSDFTVTIHLLRKMTGLLRVAYFNVKRKTRHHQLTSLSSVADPPLAFWLGNRVKFYYVMSFSCSSSIPSGADSSGLKDWGEFHRDLAIILTNRRCWSIGQDWRLHIVLVDRVKSRASSAPKVSTGLSGHPGCWGHFGGCEWGNCRLSAGTTEPVVPALPSPCTAWPRGSPAGTACRRARPGPWQVGPGARSLASGGGISPLHSHRRGPGSLC